MDKKCFFYSLSSLFLLQEFFNRAILIIFIKFDHHNSS
jgi:hypothetical protein